MLYRWFLAAANGSMFTASASDAELGMDLRASYSLTAASLILEHIDGKQSTNQEEGGSGWAADPTLSLAI